MNIEFKDRLKKCMSIRNIKPVELSERTGLSKSTISQYMSGYAKPKSDKLFIIAKELNVNEAWLIGYDDVPMEIEKTTLKINTEIEDNLYNNALQKLQRKEQLTSEELEAIKEELPKVSLAIARVFEKSAKETSQHSLLLEHFDNLSEDGKEKLIKRAEELVLLEKYHRDNKDHLQPIAAHNDYADDEEEQQLMQEDLDNL